MTYQSGVWSAPTPVPGAVSFTGVSCASSAFCVATDSEGSVLVLNGSTWSSALDIDGVVRLTAVSCAPTSFCMVADADGQSFTFSGSAWSAAAPADDDGSVQSLSCPSATFCMGVDGNGNEVTFDGSTWSSPVLVGPTDPSVISCTSSTSCVAAGASVALSFNDGSAWTYPEYFGTDYERPSGISCVASFCAEVDDEGNAATIFDAGSTVIASSGPGGTAGDAVTYSATVNSAWASQVTPTGSVAFAIGSDVQCTATLTDGSGSCTATSAPPGSDTVTATYSADATHFGSTAPPFVLTVQSSPAEPSVSSVGPSTGCAVGGSQIIITGSNLSGVSTVDFGATPSPAFTVASPTSLVATVPPGTGIVDVTVTSPDGSSTPAPDDWFSYGPVVTGISASDPIGTAVGGNTLNISGSGFTGATGVEFGGVPAESFQVIHDSEAVAVSPPGSGILDVTVTDGGCTSQISSADQYWAWPVVTSISPPTGVTAGGTVVTIIGAGFTGATAVDFGSNASPSFQVVSDSEVIAVTPPEPYKESVPVSVITSMGSGLESNARYLYDPFPASGPPTIGSISPLTARAGTSVTISGTNLGDTTSVEFGATSASFSVDSGSELTTVVPDGASSGPVTVTGTNGTVTSAQTFTLTDPSTVLPASSCGQIVTDQTLPQVYVSCGSTVSVFDDSGDLLTTISDLPEAGPMVVIGDNLYVLMEGTGSIAQINTSSFTVNQIFQADIVGATSMVYAAGHLWAASDATLDSVDPVTGATVVYSGQYIADLSASGLRSDPANPDLIYDLGAFSTINVGVSPPTVTMPESLGATDYAITGAVDGLMTPDGTHVLVDSGALFQYDVHDQYAPDSQFVDGTNEFGAVTMSDAVDGGLVAAGLTSGGLQSVELFGLASAQLLTSVSFGDDDATVPPQCLAISPNGTDLFAVTEANGTASFHAVPLSLPSSSPAFTSSAEAAVVAGETSTITVTTSGSPAASLTASGTLPPGLSFTPGADGTATISGTAAAGAGGDYPIQLTATNPNGTATQDLTVTVDPMPSVTSPSTATFTAKVGGYFALTASGSPAPSFTESGAIPSGLVFADHGGGTASISGKPGATSGGRYLVTITVDNGRASPSSQTLEITVNDPPSLVAVAEPGNLSDYVNAPIAPLHSSETNGIAPVTWSATGLPSGLRVDPSSGAVAGTPTTPCKCSVTLKATDVDGNVGRATFTWTILPFGIATKSLLPATPGKPYTPVALQARGLGRSAAGYTTTLRGTKVSLPEGLKLSSPGVISGTPSSTLVANPNGTVSVEVTETVTTIKGKTKIKTLTTVRATILLAIT